jgi:4'-phosphopantetheinyl transferase
MQSLADRPALAACLAPYGIDAVCLTAACAVFPMWLVRMRQSPRSAVLGLLSEAERERAGRFRMPWLRNRYVAAHAGLRLLGERYFGIAAPCQRFETNEFGKPCLAGVRHAQCNISYSRDHALIGLSRNKEIGVDIEAIRPIEDASELMERHYTHEEQAVLRRMRRPEAAFNKAFLTVWVRKEACVKALGSGLSIPLETIECGVTDRMTTVEVGSRQIHTGVIHAPGDHIIAWAQCG